MTWLRKLFNIQFARAIWFWECLDCPGQGEHASESLMLDDMIKHDPAHQTFGGRR